MIEFSESHKDFFDNIVIHWLTEYMISKQSSAWGHFFKMLNSKGTLIVPIMGTVTNKEEFTALLKNIGFTTEEKDVDEISALDDRFNLLEQMPVICTILLKQDPSIIWKKVIKGTFKMPVIVAPHS